MNQYSSLWTEDKLDELKRLAGTPGLSARDIGRRMEVTANAIVGKLNRLGLNKSIPERAERAGSMGRQAGGKASVQVRKAQVPLRETKRALRTLRSAKRTPPVTSFAATEKTPEPFVERPAGEAVARCSLLDLKPDSCRWPFGDPRDRDFFFCGGKALDGGPYCKTHAILAWVRGSK